MFSHATLAKRGCLSALQIMMMTDWCQLVRCTAPENAGNRQARLWSDRDIEKARKVLAGIKPGRKKKA